MLAVAAVVLMLAQPLLRNRWGALLGGAKTHHVVLLDDSFSMSDHWADTTGFDIVGKYIFHVVVIGPVGEPRRKAQVGEAGREPVAQVALRRHTAGGGTNEQHIRFHRPQAL